MKYGINCGSGQRTFETVPGEIEWINVDKVARPGQRTDVVCDGAQLNIADGQVDYFVLHHVLEHFGCGEAGDLIKEARRVLRPGGSLIVCVPDMGALAQRWLAGELSTQVYMTNVYGAYMGSEEDRHKWGYDKHTLWNFINTAAPWASVVPFDFRTIPGASIAQDWWILGMEARK